MNDLEAKAISLWSGNPFQMPQLRREELRVHLLHSRPLHLVREAIANDDLREAKRVVLAIGQAEACGPEAQISPLQKTTLPSTLVRKLPRSRAEYIRVAAAAGRCYRAMAQIRGGSDAMQELRKQVWAACFGQSLLHALELGEVIRDHDVLILGETGTGKEVVAQVFLESAPSVGIESPPSSALNAAAIPETLVESELFGHAKGAFTGASEARLGRLRAAAGGAFFLDEIGDLPQTTQVKLLRVMETNEIHPVGSDQSFVADLRYIAATHKDLETMVEKGEFRQDLFGRLAGITIRIPPLRERPDDIEEIGRQFLAKYISEGESRLDTRSVLRWLGSKEARSYSWPGNVRELQNVLRNLLLGLPLGLQTSRAKSAKRQGDIPTAIANGDATLQSVQSWYLEKVVAHSMGNLTQAAKKLGVDRSTLRRRLQD